MRRVVLSICAIGLVLGLFVGPVSGEEVPIVISPNVINIQSQGTWVTVHAEISYGIVVGATVTLNGVVVNATFADARGELVAKFAVDGVKADLVNDVGEIIDPNPVLILRGLTETGEEFTGSDQIKVNKVSAGKK